MSANDDGAKKLGMELRKEVVVEDLSSVLKSLRELRTSRNPYGDDQSFAPFKHFHIPELDLFFPTSTSPILELISPPTTHHPSGAGKTSLIYLMIAHAILPTSLSTSLLLPTHSSAVILFDPLSHFSIPHLTRVMLSILMTSLHTNKKPLDDSTTTDLKRMVSRSLLHLHIFRPQSWDSLLATLRSLPIYLFDATKHKSTHRRIHSIILEDLDIYAPAIRNKHSISPNTTSAVASNPLTDASTLLTSSLVRLSNQFSCSVITTSRSSSASSYQSVIPTIWPQEVQATKFAVRRVEVLKFAAASSVEQAEGQRPQRWDVVQRGRFECWKVGAGRRGDGGFLFRVGGQGVQVERNKEGSEV